MKQELVFKASLGYKTLSQKEKKESHKLQNMC
jgi:hypothetical protein